MNKHTPVIQVYSTPLFYLYFTFLFIFCFWVNLVFCQIDNIQQRPKPPDRLSSNTLTDTVAGYKGGNRLLFEYLENNFNPGKRLFPDESPENLTIFSFMVDSTGRVSMVKINVPENKLNTTPIQIQDEIVRILAEMPAWNPGVKDGLKVSSLVYLPINYKVNSGKLLITGNTEKTTYKNRKKLSPEKIAIIAAAGLLILGIAFLGIFK